MKKNRPPEEIDALRIQFDIDTFHGRLTLSESVRAMRKITGMTQPEYAKFLKIAERTLMDVESDRGNPTLDTLTKIGRPFGLKPGFNKEWHGDEFKK